MSLSILSASCFTSQWFDELVFSMSGNKDIERNVLDLSPRFRRMAPTVSTRRHTRTALPFRAVAVKRLLKGFGLMPESSFVGSVQSGAVVKIGMIAAANDSSRVRALRCSRTLPVMVH
jgi:hypothetical protein